MRIQPALLMLATLTPMWAQEMRLPPNLETLSAKAEESVEVTLDNATLQLATKWLPDTGEEAKAKKIMAGLKGIYVRSYRFSGEGEYTKADVEGFRTQFREPEWSRLVGTRSKHAGSNTDIFIKSEPSGTIAGIVVIAAEPRELTVVNVVGNLDPAQLSRLGGQFHIPNLDLTECCTGRRESK